MEIETCVGCGTEDNVWVFGRCTRCWLSRDELPECDGCRYGYLNQQGHMGLGGCLYEDFLKTDSFNSGESTAPAPSDSSQMYISRSRSPSPPPSSPCEKMYFCIHRHCHNPVERSGDDCKKCVKPKSFFQISDGYHCAFEECPTCDPSKYDTEPGACTTQQCDECGDLFFNRPDSDLCDSCTQDLTLSRCPDCCCLFEEWSFFGNERCRPCSTAEMENRPRCSLCGSDFEKHEVNFDQFGVCLECRTTPPCTCGYCKRCENTRRLAAPKPCPCGQQSVSDLWLQCVDCYYDERKHRFSE